MISCVIIADICILCRETYLLSRALGNTKTSLVGTRLTSHKYRRTTYNNCEHGFKKLVQNRFPRSAHRHRRKHIIHKHRLTEHHHTRRARIIKWHINDNLTATDVTEWQMCRGSWACGVVSHWRDASGRENNNNLDLRVVIDFHMHSIWWVITSTSINLLHKYCFLPLTLANRLMRCLRRGSSPCVSKINLCGPNSVHGHGDGAIYLGFYGSCMKPVHVTR